MPRKVTVAIMATGLFRRVLQCLDTLGQPYDVAAIPRVWPADRADRVLIADPQAINELGAVPSPTIVLCTPTPVSSTLLADAIAMGGQLIAARTVSPTTLLCALLQTDQRVGVDGLHAHLVALLPETPGAGRLVSAFLERPALPRPFEALCRKLRMGNRAGRQLVRDLGFVRCQHLITLLRVEAWIWLVERGLNRDVVEPFLGIGDRSNFRRACHRAQVSPPWQGHLSA